MSIHAQRLGPADRDAVVEFLLAHFDYGAALSEKALVFCVCGGMQNLPRDILIAKLQETATAVCQSDMSLAAWVGPRICGLLVSHRGEAKDVSGEQPSDDGRTGGAGPRYQTTLMALPDDIDQVFVALDLQFQALQLEPGPQQLTPLLPMLSPSITAQRDYAMVEETLAMHWPRQEIRIPVLSGVSIRSYDGQDEATNVALAEIYNSSYAAHADIPPVDGAHFRRLLTSLPELQVESFAVVAYRDERLVGFCGSFVTCNTTGYLDNYMVARDQRGRSLGNALGLGAMQMMVERGCSDIFARINASNRPSWHLAMRFGWQIAARIPIYLRRGADLGSV